ncbi:hypothetical protein [Methanopyrus sp. KOL6]|uniref:hypothetical protein n=1 Tax=Methanopyrus sp. KOL6 TaxID=1937004 RepID=UPI000B4B5015|nr:hypothetical protein [Methanopyrus sp. KOL6]
MPTISLRARERNPTNVHEARKVVEKVLKERDPELTYDQREAVRYLKKFGSLEPEDLEEVREELKSILGELTTNERTVEVLVNKILEVQPRSEEEIKILLESAGKRLLRRADEDVVHAILEVSERIVEEE